jgi:predicted RNA-binding protein with PUA-like domain
MNAGDKAFFYHSNCKEPGIAGVMEIVKEFSEDSGSLPHLYIRTPSHENERDYMFVNQQ